MRYLIKYAVKRLPREGFRSLSVPALALALVFLINVMSGVQAQMQEQYDEMIRDFKIDAVVSDSDGNAGGLVLGQVHIERFTDPESLWSLSDMVKNVHMMRTLDIIEQPDEDALPVQASLTGLEPLTEEGLRAYFAYREFPGSDTVQLELFEELFDYGYTMYDYIFACMVTEDLMEHVNDGRLKTLVIQRRGPNVRISDVEFIVTGVIKNSQTGPLIITNTFSITRIGWDVSGVWSSPETGTANGFVFHYDHFASELTIPQSISEIGTLFGVTPAILEDRTDIIFYEGYDEQVFAANEHYCVISDELSGFVNEGILQITVKSSAGAHAGNIDTEFKVVGKIAGSDDADDTREVIVYAPFSVVSEIAAESDGAPAHTVILQATVADNRSLDEFKETAMRAYKDIGVFFNELTFAMTIFDAEFYDITEALQQTIFFIDIATPFVYAISISIGFVASYLLIRRRKPEFANMRSIGVNKVAIFFGALFEQTLLCAVGVAIGCSLFTLTWDYIFIEEPLIFLGCYVLGAVFSAANAAGTDVLRLLRAKE